MPTWKSFEEFGRELKGFSVELEREHSQKITRDMGREARKIADAQAAHDLGGDQAFSGWTRARPRKLTTVLNDARGNATLLTPTKTSAGPWTVAEQGRHQGNASGFAGPGINQLTGLTARTKKGRVRKVRARRARRWNGTTRPKYTATEARTIMDRRLPPIAEKGVQRALRKHFDVTL